MNIIHHASGRPNESVLARVRKCQHNILPAIEFTEEDGFTLTCRAGHEAMGQDVDRVVSHWNRLMSFLSRELAEEVADNGAPSGKQSYCMRCRYDTGTDVVHHNDIYRAECGLCRYDKMRKSQ